MITIEQCRAARGLLDWTQQDLADASGLSKTAINNFEKGHSDIKNESLRAIRMAFESADLEFIREEGLRKKTEGAQILKGPSAFSELLDDIYQTLRENGGEILINNMDENIAGETQPKKLLEHMERLRENGITERILCAKSVNLMLMREADHRWLSGESPQTGPVTFIYGPKVALGLWDYAMIVIIESQDASRAESARFEHLWAGAQRPADKKSKSLKTNP